MRFIYKIRLIKSINLFLININYNFRIIRNLKFSNFKKIYI
jgi:hypothetical protein